MAAEVLIAQPLDFHELPDKGNLQLIKHRVGDASLTSEYSLKLRQLAGSALYGRRETSFIRVGLSCRNGIDEAALLGRKFLSGFYPLLAQSLPR